MEQFVFQKWNQRNMEFIRSGQIQDKQLIV